MYKFKAKFAYEASMDQRNLALVSQKFEINSVTFTNIE